MMVRTGLAGSSGAVPADMSQRTYGGASQIIDTASSTDMMTACVHSCAVKVRRRLRRPATGGATGAVSVSNTRPPAVSAKLTS
ncbi:hypothetical protein Ari01nite_07490 [Paractinoplanes rishiriensis]|uniref:Uncharacterized protein n=1 Tax=Paractinoplanes rishiriensis TaxID=1050105 RepID=A0A919JTM3_9ACTN|nr:hypothetical protein Ari01nite_07490 [Actinoplanes rishiriensis]